ncbi:MAG: hypothetical protein LBF38_10600 [Deltaproteobacteria bacterium]|jgi:hypothetical protein|nr:hypothetical protein [Deltaproteobacteria bacterium]
MKSFLFAAMATLFFWGALFSGTLAMAQTFRGHDCYGNCDEFQRGYYWAQDYNIGDQAQCDDGYSTSFAAGCYAYIDDDYEEHPDRYEIYEDY